MAASRGFAEQSTALAAAGTEQVEEGLAELAPAHGAKKAAQTLVLEGVEQVAEGAQHMGQAEMADSH